MQQMETLPGQWHQKVEAIIGPFAVIHPYRPANARTGVWKLRSKADGQFCFFKTYSRKSRWHPEVFAYRHWIDVLKPYVPELLAVFEEEEGPGILISAMDGTIMRELSLEPEAELKAYRQAGQLTRLLHNSRTGEWFGRPDQDGNPIELFHHHDPVAYITRSLTDISGLCADAGVLEPKRRELLEWALDHSYAFEGEKPVPISWDSTPGNWLVDPDGGFAGMIDFENMLWGFAADHFPILFERYFCNNDSAKQAFFDGYGPEVLASKAVQIRICCIKLALGDLYWGKVHSSPRVMEFGANMLREMLSK